MAEFDTISELRRSGLRRLRDAEELVQPPSINTNEAGSSTRHLRGAMYLAGYGVECSLKVYIISRVTGCIRLSEARDVLINRGQPIKDICGATGHNLAYLLSLTDLEAGMDVPQQRAMGVCNKWKSTWRYHAQPAVEADAKAPGVSLHF